MGTKHHEFEWIQTQLTLTRWHLNAAAHATSETLHRHLHQAHRMYEVTARSLSELSLDGDQRSFIERELAAVRARLDADDS